MAIMASLGFEETRDAGANAEHQRFAGVGGRFSRRHRSTAVAETLQYEFTS